ncbi:double-strand break repair protein AddB [Paracoccus hibiscisoli]|uniref:Double-strand break repair protein AddB n=1 Tax=Paracoccus hibiscisoli TaxID=2023261 RepID=A0A4U0QSZ2_9RHOB|nr:double-strand break repair protein AddB [Paracoccus hibiscisoli]TJZ85117.1 double-strand break repair protein AddB [Paracoccus hibiscisoli]
MAEMQGLYALPPGLDFADCFVQGLLERMSDQPSEALARVTILTNAATTMGALRRAFDRAGPLLLPQIRSITGVDPGPLVMPDPPVPPLARRLQLARLIAQMLALRPDLGAGHSIPVLAQSLSQLMVEMQTEGRDLSDLEAIDTGDHARHWQNALAFLRIAAQFHLGDPSQDRPARQRAASEAAARDWPQGIGLPPGPVIVAGSTGSHGATRLYMQAVAALPNGAVVLPGFDFDQPPPVWDGLERADDHPQARFAPLIAAAGYPRRWTQAQPPSAARNRLVSLALRPAPVTDQWIAEGPALPDLVAATADLTLIEADQPGQEAETIALIMRDAAERGDLITLIAADSGLIRRVTAALDRWHIRPDDSAGRPLPLTAPGLFLRQVAALFGQPLTIDRLLILLKHPLTATGSTAIGRNQMLRETRELELQLRRNGPAFPDADTLADWATKGDETRKIWAEWLAAMLVRITALARDRGPRPLPDRLSDLMGLAQALAAGPAGDVDQSRLWQDKAGQMARAVLNHLAEHAGLGPDIGPGDFSALLVTELQAKAVREDVAGHHCLRIRGPREARLYAHGTVILSGLNEGGWPQPLSPDPWLSRQMRAAAGLPLPERQIGLAAHDFQQGIAAERVILTRAKRDAEAETIPSRWLNRMLNLMGGLPDRGGPQALAAMRARGAEWLALAEAVARPPAPVAPARRPSPIPPAPLFPDLPVTDVSLLIRDPYAVYAKRVLGLRPLPPLRPQPDASLRGQTLHAIVEALLNSRPTPDTPPEVLKARFLALTDQVLADEVPWPAARAFWQARIARIADRIVTDELARLAEGTPMVVENRGKVALPGMGVTLTAKPDRIDLLTDNRVVVYDYKSGTPPTDAQLRHFDKQLMLEAAMARRGGFDALGPVDVAGLRYIQLGGEGRTHLREHSDQIEGETWDGFIRLLRSYVDGEAGFTAMRAPQSTSYAGDYDHLARYGEWALTDVAVPRKVGDHG